MTTPYPRTRAFELHHLQAMVGAFDLVCAQLRIPVRGGARETKHVASRIFDLAMTGVLDEDRLVATVLAEHQKARWLG